MQLPYFFLSFCVITTKIKILKTNDTESCILFITGRNEVLAKVMFLQASVILSTGGQCALILGGALNFALILGGALIFLGGLVL